MCRVDHLGARRMQQSDTLTTITPILRRSFCNAIPTIFETTPRQSTGSPRILRALKLKRRVWPGGGG